MKEKSFKSLNPASIMDRYIAVELLLPFLFGLGTFASVGVAVDTVFDLIRKVVESDLPLSIAVNIFLLKIPYFIVLALPMSTLLAALMAYSRLSSDSELIALRSCGVSIYRLVLPAIIFSFVVTGITFWFNEQVVPAANYRADVTLERALKKEKPKFQEQNIFYPEYREVKQLNGNKAKLMTLLFYADQFDGQRMKGLTIVERSQEGLDKIVVAESAMWNPAQNTWDFFNGTSYIVAPDSSYRKISQFERQQVPLPRTPLDLARKSRDYGQMNIAQSQEQLEILRLSGDDQKIRKLKLRIQQKIALPFVCLIFGLVGAAVGARPGRTSRATSFGISIVVIFSYYLLYFIIDAMGQAGALSPWMAAWLPTMVCLGAGGLLLVRTAQ